MNGRRVFSLAALVLGAIALFYFVVGSVYVHRESQREERWHDKAVANAATQSVAEWALARGTSPVIEWLFVNEKRHTYAVRLFDDRRYVSAVYDQVVHGVGHPMDSPVPRRFETGKLSRAEWRALTDLVASMYDEREAFFASSHRKDGNVTLAWSLDNAVPVRYRLRSAEYARWPARYRDFDQRLFAVMAGWHVKPHHGYSRALPKVSYGSETLQGLIGLLQSDRESAYPALVSRLVALGEPGRAALLEVLRSGEQNDYLPTARYVAVMNGLAPRGDDGDAALVLMRRLAEAPASVPGRKALKAHATSVVDAYEVARHVEQTWTLPEAVEASFRTGTLTAADEAIVAAALADIDLRLDAKRNAAKAALIGVGTPALPAVIAKLKADRARNRHHRDLLDVAAEVGGWPAMIYAVREGAIAPSSAIRPLERIGERGVPGLLMLLASPDELARMESFFALEKEAYAAHAAQFIAELDRNLARQRAASSDAVRAVHSDAAVRLMKLLHKHDPSGRAPVDVLFKAAMDTGQAEQTRVTALESLAALTPLPAAVDARLRELAGYESGKVYKALEALWSLR